MMAALPMALAERKGFAEGQAGLGLWTGRGGRGQHERGEDPEDPTAGSRATERSHETIKASPLHPTPPDEHDGRLRPGGPRGRSGRSIRPVHAIGNAPEHGCGAIPPAAGRWGIHPERCSAEPWLEAVR
jgi:hypothetical protein